MDDPTALAWEAAAARSDRLRQGSPCEGHPRLEQRFTNKLRQGKCKTLEASRNKAKELEKAIIEFRERTGEPLNDRLQATVMLGIVDEETAIAMEAKGTNSSDFKALRGVIEQRYINKQARKIDMGDQPDNDPSTMGTEGDCDW